MKTLTTRPPRVCLAPGCGVIGNFERGRCPKHIFTAEGQSRGKLRPMEHLYRSWTWRDKFRPRFLSFNPICQRILDGQRCHNAATELHHLLEPTTAQMFYDPKNIVGLCVHCHPGGRPGTPEWREGTDYVPTMLENPTFGYGRV